MDFIDESLQAYISGKKDAEQTRNLFLKTAESLYGPSFSLRRAKTQAAIDQILNMQDAGEPVQAVATAVRSLLDRAARRLL